MERKDDLRRRFRSARSLRTARDLASSAERMRQWAPELAALSGAAIAAFQPTNSEPDVGPLLLELMHRHGVTVLIPRPVGEQQLDWVTADADSFSAGLTGIPRPVGPAVAHAGQVAAMVGVILLPALAMDPQTGARLGYGAGYYDRLLADLAQPVRLIAVCDDTELVDLPIEDHDRPVDSVLTAAGLRPVGR